MKILAFDCATKRKTEIWKDIQYYEGSYQISNMGRVKSLKRLDCNNRPIPEKILKISYTHKGYARIQLSTPNRKKYFIHQLVAKAFIPNPFNKCEVNHKYGIKNDNRVSELEWCNHSENEKHAYRTGLKIKRIGDLHPLAQLMWQKVNDIRALFDTGLILQKQLAEIYKVNRRHISRIVNYKTWKVA